MGKPSLKGHQDSDSYIAEGGSDVSYQLFFSFGFPMHMGLKMLLQRYLVSSIDNKREPISPNREFWISLLRLHASFLSLMQVPDLEHLNVAY